VPAFRAVRRKSAVKDGGTNDPLLLRAIARTEAMLIYSRAEKGEGDNWFQALPRRAWME